ncbi:MAG: HAMP domain-containing protein [Anaerolineaceae bacterium]|nr:HAMP domain-containing protein [Anaerolineaceae bacterium]
MSFFSSINSRLWLTYVLLVALVLVAAFSGIVVAFRNSPLLYWKEFVRLNYVTDSLTNHLDFYVDTKWNRIVELFLTEAKLLDVRVIIVDRGGSLILDSGSSQNSKLARIDDPSAAFAKSEGKIRIFRDEGAKTWFYRIRPINDIYFLIAAIPRPTIQIQTILQDRLLTPLFRAGIIALGITFIVSWFVARWITRPLKNISNSAQQLALGNFPPIRLEGPSEVQQLAGVINEMDLKVRKSLQSQKEFVANVSHEFKTPLTSIQGFAQAILDGAVETKEEKRHAAQIILDETSRLNYLVNDLLMLARLDAGTMILNRSEIQVNQIIENVLEKFKFRIEKKSITIKRKCTKQIFIYADGERIIQVLTIILDNAIKFTQAGGWIDISTSVEEGFGKVSILDSGVGIPEKDQKRIFDRFYQVDKSRHGGNDKGVGLGLSIARQIVLAHGGEITVTSELGKGSCFMVKIPLVHEK